MDYFTRPIYRTTLNKYEKDELASWTNVGYTDEKDASKRELEILAVSPFKLGDKVKFDPNGFYGNDPTEDPNQIHIIDVIDYDGQYFSYMIDLEDGGGEIYGWVEDIDLTKTI